MILKIPQKNMKLIVPEFHSSYILLDVNRSQSQLSLECWKSDQYHILWPYNVKSHPPLKKPIAAQMKQVIPLGLHFTSKPYLCTMYNICRRYNQITKRDNKLQKANNNHRREIIFTEEWRIYSQSANNMARMKINHHYG